MDPIPIPRETDILVIGGAAIGSSVAYWLKQRNPEGFNATVVEQDPTVSLILGVPVADIVKQSCHFFSFSLFTIFYFEILVVLMVVGHHHHP